MGFFKKEPAVLTCPFCNCETEQDPKWFLENDEYACPQCSKTVTVDKEKYADVIKKAKRKEDNKDVLDSVHELGF